MYPALSIRVSSRLFIPTPSYPQLLFVALTAIVAYKNQPQCTVCAFLHGFIIPLTNILTTMNHQYLQPPHTESRDNINPDMEFFDEGRQIAYSWQDIQLAASTAAASAQTFPGAANQR